MACWGGTSHNDLWCSRQIKVDEFCICINTTKKHSTNLIQKFWFAKHSTTLWKYIYNVNKPLVTHKLLMRSAEKEVEQRDMMLGVQVLPTNLLTSWSSHRCQCCCYYVAVGKVSHKLLLLWQVIQNDLTSLEITKSENCHKKKKMEDINVALYMYYIHRSETCTHANTVACQHMLLGGGALLLYRRSSCIHLS